MNKENTIAFILKHETMYLESYLLSLNQQHLDHIKNRVEADLRVKIQQEQLKNQKQ